MAHLDVERRIAALRVLLGVSLTAPGCQREATLEDCAGEKLPAMWVVADGYIAVEPGAACPEFRHDLEVQAFGCCPAKEWRGFTCEFVGRENDQVHNGYGGWSNASTSNGPVTFDGPRDLCEYSAVFEGTDICCGRPLLNEGRPVVATIQRAVAWHGEAPRIRTASMTRRERRRAGEDWLRSARLEHASIASFARFTLELLRYGAPPELVSAAQSAGADEVRHAQLCFALASAFLGDDLGPGPLELVEAATLSDSIVDFAEAVAREGCIGETLSALDAAARRSHATDPAVCAALETIEKDESRHAALAWRTLRWLLERDDGPAMRRHLASVFSCPPAVVASDDEASDAERAAGRIRSRERKNYSADAWRRVVEPGWKTLATS